MVGSWATCLGWTLSVIEGRLSDPPLFESALPKRCLLNSQASGPVTCLLLLLVCVHNEPAAALEDAPFSFPTRPRRQTLLS